MRCLRFFYHFLFALLEIKELHEKSIMTTHPFLWDCFLESQTLANSIANILDFGLALVEHYEAPVSLSI